jgi:molybdopterin molybdotransferase
LAIGRDDLPELTQRIRAGLEYDLLITIGGVSVGDYDFVSEALRAVGVAVAFHKVAIKPGKPLLFGVHGRTPVIGLPGNPVSALVTFEVFVRPALRRMQGLQDAFDELVEVVLAAPFAHKTGRTEFVRASVTYTSGQWIARVHAAQSSAALTSLTGSTALVVLPSDQAEFAAGERLSALLVPAPRRSDTPFAE